MSLFNAFRYDGKRVLVVGGATGMGAAAAQLALDAGAEVVVMDFAEIPLEGVRAIHVNLAEQASIDAAITECGGSVDVLLSCAGVADGTPGIEKINFIGHRHMIDSMLASGMLSRGSNYRVHLIGRRSRLAKPPPGAGRVLGHSRLRQRRQVGRSPRKSGLHVDQAGHLRLCGQPGFSTP